MLMPTVFAEFESLGYKSISLVKNWIFPVWPQSLSRCILYLSWRHCHFRLCIWAEGWNRQQSKGKGHGLKTQDEASPQNHKHTPQLMWDKPSVWDWGPDKRALSLARLTHSGWDGHQWHRVKGHVADNSRRNCWAQEVLSNVKPGPNSIPTSKLWGIWSKQATEKDVAG